MLAMVSGGRAFAANPLDGLTFLFEPVRPLAADDPSGIRGPHDRAARATRSTRSAPCCSSPRRCCRSPAGRRSSRSSATGSARDGRRRPAARGQPRSRSGRRATSTASWPLVDRIGYWLCWATGIGLCLIARAIVLYMFVKGIAYLRPEPVRDTHPRHRCTRPRAAASATRSIGTLLRDRDRHADRGAARGRDRGLAVGVRAPGVARARGRVGDRDARRRAEHRARDLRPADLLAGLPRLPLAARADRRGRSAQSFFDRRDRDVAARAAAGRRLHARGAGAAARPRCARPPTRSARRARRRSGSVLLPSIRPSIASGVVLGMGRIIGDTAIVTILLGATLKNEPVGQRAARSARCAAPARR